MTRLTLNDLRVLKASGEPIAGVTAYDYAGIKMAEDALIDILMPHDWLIGTVLFGQLTGASVTMEHLLFYLRGLVQSVQRAYIVAPLPFGCYEVSNEQAVRNAARLIKEGADSVVVQGAGTTIDRIAAMTEVGIPCMGYLGYLPQQVKKLGKECVVGTTACEAASLYKDAIALQQTGAWGVILHNVAGRIAVEIAKKTELITIGIGGTRGCDGYIAFMHELLGWPMSVAPLFSMQKADFFERAVAALNRWHDEVQSLQFPQTQNTFAIAEEDYQAFIKEIEKTANVR